MRLFIECRRDCQHYSCCKQKLECLPVEAGWRRPERHVAFGWLEKGAEKSRRLLLARTSAACSPTGEPLHRSKGCTSGVQPCFRTRSCRLDATYGTGARRARVP